MKSLPAAARCTLREFLFRVVNCLHDLERVCGFFMACLQLCGGMGVVL
jgi:hypothetical protein